VKFAFEATRGRERTGRTETRGTKGRNAKKSGRVAGRGDYENIGNLGTESPRRERGDRMERRGLQEEERKRRRERERERVGVTMLGSP